MQPLSSAAGAAIAEAAQRHGFGLEATHAMLDALIRGGGRMAQFEHPEFSGRGQWMRGGMTMVSDMFNHDLKGRVDALCSDLSNLLAERPTLFQPPIVPGSPLSPSGSSETPGSAGPRWPSELGSPDSSGSQNDMRYAVFGHAHRLAIERDGRVTVYDTLDHRIGGVSQQQGEGGSLRFTSQHGPIDLSSLPVASGTAMPSAVPASPASRSNAIPVSGAVAPRPTAPAEIAATLETLADLKAKGIVSAAEFDAKKAELLARL